MQRLKFLFVHVVFFFYSSVCGADLSSFKECRNVILEKIQNFDFSSFATEQVRTEMHPNAKIGQGYSILDLRDFFPETLMVEMMQAYLAKEGTQSRIFIYPSEQGNPLSSEELERQRNSILFSDTFSPFVQWVDYFLFERLKVNPARASYPIAEIRVIEDNVGYYRPDVLLSHYDSGLYALVLPLVNVGPRVIKAHKDLLLELPHSFFKDMPKEWNLIEEVPRGRALFLSGEDRFEKISSQSPASVTDPVTEPTLHVVNTNTGPRMLLVVRWHKL